MAVDGAQGLLGKGGFGGSGLPIHALDRWVASMASWNGAEASQNAYPELTFTDQLRSGLSGQSYSPAGFLIPSEAVTSIDWALTTRSVFSTPGFSWLNQLPVREGVGLPTLGWRPGPDTPVGSGLSLATAAGLDAKAADCGCGKKASSALISPVGSGEPMAVSAMVSPANTLPAFPGAEGFGASATGGRGGQVIYVTTTATSGPGSLQWAIDQPGPKYILFKVSGLIDARIHLRNGDATIAGHTSPGGITIRGFVTDETPYQDQEVRAPSDFAENWILQHIRIRPGLNGPSDDGLRLRYTRNAIVDHVSVGNATDEAVEISYSNNITIQNSMLAETLGGHSFYGGMLINYSNPAHGFALDNLSIHHNLFNRIEGRLPEASRESLAAAGSTMNLEISSNLYWDPRFFIALGPNTGQLTDGNGNPYPIYYRLNAVNNYFRTGSSFPYGMWDDQILRESSAPSNQLHVQGNRMSLYPTRSDYALFYCCNDYPQVTNPDTTSRLAQNMAVRHAFPTITYTPALDLPTVLPNRVGAWPRDPMDTRLLQSVRENLIDPTSPSTNPYGDALLPPYVGPPPAPPTDSDNDGMPDTWEIAKGLNPNLANHNGTNLSTLGYTNLEVYLHELATNLTNPNPNIPVITLAVSPASVLENGTANLVYTFSRTGPTNSALTVNYTVGGTATLGTDYTGIAASPATKTLSFAAGSATAIVTVDPTADSTVEANETVALTLATGTGYTVGTTSPVTGTITNDDVALPAITLAVSPASVTEDGTANLVYTFTRSGSTSSALTVNYTVNGTATLGTDYTGIAASPATKTLSFAAGSATAIVTVDPTADSTVEANETVALTLATGTGYTVGTTGAVTGTITNDDGGSTGNWTRLLGTTAYEQSSAIALGSDGALYLGGFTEGNLHGQTNNGFADGFLTKYLADGTQSWTRLLGTGEYDRAFALAASGDGAIYIAGSSEGNLDGQTHQGSGDIFLTRYQADGTKSWSRLLGSPAEEAATALTTGGDGSIYVAGYTQGGLDGQSNSGGSDGLISKYSATGSRLWTRLLGTSSEDRATALARGSDGAIYVAGYTNGGLHGQTNNGTTDGFLSKYDANGNRLWTQLLGGTAPDLATAVTVGNEGAIYVGGYSEGNLHGQTSNGGVDAFISRYDSNGNRLWTKLLGGPSYEAANAITLGSNGNLYLAGYTEGSLDGQVNGGSRDIFISQYLPDGTKVSTQLLGTSAADQAKGLVGGSDGAFYVTGDTSGNLNGQINNGGSSDIFLTKLVNTPSTSLVVIAATDATAGETNNPGQFTLTRTGSTAAALTVNLTRTGTALNGTDYTTSPATVSFAAGSSTTVVNLTATDDLLVEGNETVIFTLSSGTGYTVGATASATVTISDNDLNGTTGADNLLGDSGRNALNGLAGSDILNGGAEADRLTGGNGADTFVFQFGQSILSALDHITDFAIGTDKIDLLTAGGAAMAAPAAFSRAANNSATTLSSVISNVFTDANGGLAGNQGLGLNSAALVVASASAIAGTYLVINDGVAGFQAATDLVINLTGHTGTLPGLGTITASTWFV